MTPQQRDARAIRQRKLTVTLFTVTIVSLIMLLPFVISLFLLTTVSLGLYPSDVCYYLVYIKTVDSVFRAL